MQGDVTEIINMTPALAEIIDEIAGVAEFDQKKEAAFEELEVVRERIDEAELRIEEKQTRLDQLEDERETALAYQSLAVKEEYEGYRKAANSKTSARNWKRSKREIDELRKTNSPNSGGTRPAPGTVVRLEDELEALNEIERKGRGRTLAIKRGDRGRSKGRHLRLEDKIETAEEKSRTPRTPVARHSSRSIASRDDRRPGSGNPRAQGREVQRQSRDTGEGSRTRRVQQHIDEVGGTSSRGQNELESKRADLEEAKSEKNDLQREQNRLIDEARRRSNEQREKREAIEEAEADIPDLESEIGDLETRTGEGREEQADHHRRRRGPERAKQELQSSIDDLEDDISAKQQGYAELEARAGQDGDSSYGRAVTSILNAGIEGVHGTVGQLGGVDPDLRDRV